MLTGLGSTETAPSAIFTTPETSRAGAVGVPLPGVEVKLAPVGDKLEGRVRGPNITPGYWRDEAVTRKAFDEEGYYRFGDALRFLDEKDESKGLLLRRPHRREFQARDRHLGHGRNLAPGVPCGLRALSRRTWSSPAMTGTRSAPWSFPTSRRAGAYAPSFRFRAALAEVLRHETMREMLSRLLASFAQEAKGSSTRIARLILLEEPPSIDANEITDKGSINQRAVLTRRAREVEALYAPSKPRSVIEAKAASFAESG